MLILQPGLFSQHVTDDRCTGKGRYEYTRYISLSDIPCRLMKHGSLCEFYHTVIQLSNWVIVKKSKTQWEYQRLLIIYVIYTHSKIHYQIISIFPSANGILSDAIMVSAPVLVALFGEAYGLCPSAVSNCINRMHFIWLDRCERGWKMNEFIPLSKNKPHQEDNEQPREEHFVTYF